MEDFPAISLAPLPYAFYKFLSAKIVASFPLPGDFTLDDILGRNSGVVGARYPQGVIPLHPARSDDHVLQGIVERVAEM
jgi:hypothetical protein